jgi:hypothetical protein
MRALERILLVGIATVWSGVPSSAHALSCTTGDACTFIAYTIAGNVFSPDLGQTVATNTGTATLEFQAVAENDIRSGPVHLMSLEDDFVIDFSVGGLVTVQGALAFDAAASQSGVLFFPAGQRFGALLLGMVTGAYTGVLHCAEGTPGICFSALSVPPSQSVPLGGPAYTNINLKGTPSNPISAGRLNWPHTLNFMTSVSLAGITGIGTTVLTEVSRTFMPEPATGSLLALGLLGLALGGRSWRVRR